MTLVTMHEDGALFCNKCGRIEPDQPIDPKQRMNAWNHLLTKHREECVAAHGEVAVAKVEAMR